MHLLVAAIDFGTTYSGWGFSFKHEFNAEPTKVQTKRWTGGKMVSLKGPTCALINSDGETLEAFGFEAESRYATLAASKSHDKYYFFQRFKMALYGRIGIERDIRIEDIRGKKTLPAKKVFALSIKYLKDDLLEMSNNRIGSAGLSLDEIRWVLTVPAIWNDAAKQFMREAAEEAGIPSENLSICLEPEAASLYCRYLPVEKNEESLGKLKTGSKYLVVDAGGGTVDMTVHEVMFDGTLKELHKASGGDWGGTKVNEAFEDFINKICGNNAIEQLKQEDMEDYLDLSLEFEIKKREIRKGEVKPGQTNLITFRVPITLKEILQDQTELTLNDQIKKKGFAGDVTLDKDKLRLSENAVHELFHPTVQRIIDHINALLKEPQLQDCSTILMVGGFSESKILQQQVKEAFSSKTIIIPSDAGLAVLKGAVIFGHVPDAISERICKMTYGFRSSHTKDSTCNHLPCPVKTNKNGDLLCYNLFRSVVKEGTSVKLGEKQSEIIYSPIDDDQSNIDFRIFASSSPDVHLVTEDCCTQIGNLTVQIPDKSLGRKREFGISLMFGGTEIKVIVEDKASGEVTTKFVDFLG